MSRNAEIEKMVLTLGLLYHPQVEKFRERMRAISDKRFEKIRNNVKEVKFSLEEDAEE